MNLSKTPVVLLILVVGALFAVGAVAATDGVQGDQTDEISTAQTGNITFNDQATASSTFTAGGPSTPGVVVGPVDSDVDSAVVVTYPDSSLQAGDQVTVDLDNVGASAWEVNGVSGDADSVGDVVVTDENNPTLRLVEGVRYTFAGLPGSNHPLEFFDANGDALLSQSTEGSYESDPAVNWTDSGDSVSFTATAALTADFDGYECTIHSSSMVGDTTSTAATDLVIAGLDTFAASDLDGGSVAVPVEDVGGFPGDHTAHLIPTANLSGNYTPGDVVSNETASAIIDNEQATVFQGTLDLEDQTVDGPVQEGETLATVSVANLTGGDAAFTVDVHPTDENGTLIGPAYVGSSDVLTGQNTDVPITAEQAGQSVPQNEFPLTGVNDLVAMIHVVDDNASAGDPASPGEYPVLPHGSANGFVPGGVTDPGTVAVDAPNASVSFGDQATASSTFTSENVSTPGVGVTVDSEVDSAVVITYPQGDNLTIAGLDTFNASELTGESVFIPVADTGGFPGQHTAHVIPTANLSGAYAPGDNVSAETASEILANEAATVFQGIVDFANQSFEDATTEVTAATAGLVGDPDTLFAINLHETTAEGAPGAFVGASPVLSGVNEDVPIPLLDIEGNQLTFNTSDEYIAMIHVVDDENVSEGDLLPPAAFPILPHASADGVVPGGVTDGGEVAIFSAEGAELDFGSQALGVDAQGNAVVYVDNITEAEQVEQTDVSNPVEDFVVMYEGETLTQDSLVDFRNVGDAQNGELLLRADNATPGTHTVELYADARFSIDPTAQDIDVDHPLIEKTTAESDETGDSDGYLVVLEEDLQAPAGVDRASAAQRLQQQADLAQAPVVDSLERLDGATVEQQYWITNALLVSTDGVSKTALERLDGVEYVVENIEAEHPSPAPTTGDAGEFRSTANHNVTYGLDAIDVPGFEETYNTQGEGTRVAIIDDGLNVSHPDIDVKLGVQVADGQVINESPTITPGSQHGAHVAGTAVGTADPAGDVPRYSVAPGADLLKADIWVGDPTLGDTITAVQWSVGENADVTSMSLGFGQGVGESTVVPLMADTIQNAEDAGTLVIGSAGNEGSGAAGGPVTSPGAEFNGLSVGASAEGGAIAGFSSGTTVTPNDVLLFPAGASYPDYFPREYLKPDVAAPGVGVLSTGPLGTLVAEDPAYSLSSGTSMAAPHAAGAAALVQAATTEQLDPTTIESALAESAEKPTTEFGGQNERDIRYGTGIINVTAATMAAQNTTTISGTITDSATGDALAGVQVTTDTGVTTATGANGTYSLTVTNDTDSTVVSVEAFGFTDETETVSLGSDQTVDFALDPEVAVTPVAGQPAFAEFQDSFTIVLDVRNLEEYAVDLADAQGVTPADINVTVAGTTLSPGESVSLGSVSADGVPVTVEVDGTFSEGDQFALAHTFSGPGADIDVTTGPTTLTETIDPATFELSGFSAPSEQPDPAQPVTYVPEVTVTNVGQTPGAAEVRWFAGPLGLQGDNPVEQLAPGESATVSLNFGPLNFASILGGPVEFLHGFDAVPQGAGVGDLTFERFTVGDGLVPLLNPIDSGQPRGAAESTGVLAADVTIDDQTFGAPTSEVTVSSSSVLPDDEEYVIVVHENTEGLPILGNSGVLNGSQTDVTVSLDQSLSTTTDLVAMLHFEQNGTFGPPITAFDPAAGAPTPVTDTATASFGSLTFEDQFVDGELAEVTEVESGGESAVVVTYPEGGELVIAGLTTGTFDNETVQIALEDTGGLPGNHTAHIIPTSGLSGSYAPGDTVSAATAANISDQETATVGIDIDDNNATAADTTNDGLLNDVNGDGSFDIFDVQVLFDHLDNETIQAYPDLFDFAGIPGDRVSIFDVQGLFAELLAQGS